MLKYVLSVQLLVTIASLCGLPTTAIALDCTKAKKPVEVAICTDDHLGNMDDLLSTTYFDLLRDVKLTGLRRGTVTLHDALQADQRRWLAQRDKICGAEPNDRVIRCVSDSITERRTVLYEIGRPAKGDTLTIGSETLVVGLSEYGDKSLEYNGKVVVEDLGPEFTIAQRWSSPDANAILLDTGQEGTLHCSSTYVLAASKRGMEVHRIGEGCLGFDLASESKTERGFAWSMPPTPTRNGTVVEWDAYRGAVTTKKPEFRPENGTTMLGLVASNKPAEQEPLKNQEFFNAVDKLPPAHRKRVMASLWQVANGCEGCRDNTGGRERYGVSLNSDVIVYSGCGWDMESVDLNCGEDDALGVWDRKSGAFFFAVEPHRSAPSSVTDADVYVYPSLAQWPQVARQRFQLWREGAKLVKQPE